VAVVDDDRRILQAWKRMLTGKGFEISLFDDPLEFVGGLESSPADVLIADIMMPQMNGLALLSLVKQRRPDVEVVMTTALTEMNLVIEAMRKGAFDFFTKPYENTASILETLQKAARERRERAHRTPLSGPPSPLLIGQCEPMRKVMELVRCAAASDAPVLVGGESGTGKELIARAIVESSGRRTRPFLTVNCAGLVETLLEEELFGHVRGAFTGAVSDRRGIFEAAHAGSVFLDEIAEMSPRCQATLLRTLQEGEVRPVGTSQVRKVDVRVLAASNVELEERCNVGAFRRDLFYRLNVIQIRLPPLRERIDDLPLLVDHFLAKYGGNASVFPESTLAALARHSWPGNVRELENVVQRAVILSQGARERISTSDLPSILQDRREASTPSATPERRDLAKQRFERAYLLDLLARYHSISAAARAAQMDRSNFKRLLRRHAINPSEIPEPREPRAGEA
jgi:two-component system response regulator HydG